MSYLKPGENRYVGTTTTVGGTTYTGSSPRTSNYVSSPTAHQVGGTVLRGSSPRSSTYIPTTTTGGFTSQAKGITGLTTGTPKSSIYLPGGVTQGYSGSTGTYTSTGGTYTSTGGTYTGAPGSSYKPTGSPRGSTYIPAGTTTTTYGGTTPTGKLSSYTTTSTTGGKVSTYVPGGTTTSGGKVSTYVSGGTTTSGGSGETDYLKKRTQSLQEEVSKLRSENINLKNEISRVAANQGARYDHQMGKVVTHGEYNLQKQVEQLSRENQSLKDDKDRMSLIIHDLKRYAPDYKGDEPDDPDLDGSYLNLKHKNVIETLELGNKQLKKKNRMLLDENEMLKTQVRTLCAADDGLNDKFLQSEVGKLQQKIRELKTKNNEMEISLKTYESDRKLGVKNKYDVVNFDDGMREEYERMKRELTNAYKKINELESGENALGRANIDKYRALTNRVSELEQQNQNLLSQMKDRQVFEHMRKSMTGAEEDIRDQEIFQLRQENDRLRQELMERNEMIRKLQSSKGLENGEAIQNLISANERLLAQVMQYQERLNQSQSMNMSMNHRSHAFGGGEKKKEGVLKSEFMDPYKDSKYTFD